MAVTTTPARRRTAASLTESRSTRPKGALVTIRPLWSMGARRRFMCAFTLRTPGHGTVQHEHPSHQAERLSRAKQAHARVALLELGGPHPPAAYGGYK